MISRRGFLAGILAAGSAPALCKAGFLMPVKQLAIVNLVPENVSPLFDFEDSLSCRMMYNNEHGAQYQWLRNGKPIPGAVFDTFTPRYR